MSNLLWLIAPLAAILSLFWAFLFYRQIMKYSEGNERMKEIASYVREGAYSYLTQQYKVVAYFFVITTILLFILSLFFHFQNNYVPIAFLVGGFFSGLAGFYGMKTATNSSARTTYAAMKSLNQGLKIAFRAGAVMGLTVVGLGLLYISLWFAILKYIFPIFNLTLSNSEISTLMLSFGMGASTQALFARIGGGIFTKAADVGADLVGKVEEGIPEDDPRNPATIADNVGDNVGDVAGMGADLFESYINSILAAIALGSSAYALTSLHFNAIILPMVVAGAGILSSIIGIYAVKTGEELDQKKLLKALMNGVVLSSILVTIFSFLAVIFLLPGHIGLFGSIIAGLLTGIIIGQGTEYYTSYGYKPTVKLAEQAKTGSGTLIIGGFAQGMMSTWIPILAIVFGMVFAYLFAGGKNSLTKGLYGIGLAAVGMLSTLGITLATDAYGPVADNAGGNAEMSELGEEVRKRTDALDSLGNTTAATGKGFAIGSAALTALALIVAFINEIKSAMIKLGISSINLNGQVLETAKLNVYQIVDYYKINFINPNVLIGLFLGAATAFLFSALTLKSVGRAAFAMVEEVRRQFKSDPGIIKGESKPDYKSCVKISTLAAQKEMILPSLLVIFIPIITGIFFGVAGVVGLLSGGLATGFVLAVTLNNAGGAWDNAKKYVELGNFGGKGSLVHKSTVVGDTVGDPFKDTTGPSLNILIKLMSVISIVFAELIIKLYPYIHNWLGL